MYKRLPQINVHVSKIQLECFNKSNKFCHNILHMTLTVFRNILLFMFSLCCTTMFEEEQILYMYFYFPLIGLFRIQLNVNPYFILKVCEILHKFGTVLSLSLVCYGVYGNGSLYMLLSILLYNFSECILTTISLL